MKLYVRVPMEEKHLMQLKPYFDEIVKEPWTDTGERYYEDEMIRALKMHQPDVLITELDRVTEKVLEEYQGLKVIGDCRANPANIDVEACKKHGVAVLCTPARNAQAVAELLVGLLITFWRNVIPSVNWVKEGGWKEGTTPYYLWMGHELYGKRIGFVGFGAVGQAAARILEAFGCGITFYDPYVEPPKASWEKCSLEDIFSKSDVVSIHLPVLDSTKGMVDRRLLESMKETAVFVNTARTAVVDQTALKELLEQKRIRGAVLDVLDTEPPAAADLEIGKLENVLLTPHICGSAFEVTDHQADIITERLTAWLKAEK